LYVRIVSDATPSAIPQQTRQGAAFLTSESAAQLKQRLKGIGLSDPAIRAAWPVWWSDDADASTSAKAELRFSLSRKLGLDPHSLLEEDVPRFVWKDAARFKHLRGETELEQAGITSFGVAVGSVLVSATKLWRPVLGSSAAELRMALMEGQPFVGLPDLLALAWSVGIPTVHLRVFPWSRKRMTAMAVQIGPRSAILLGRDSDYPAQIAFYVAHELGHFALGHVGSGDILVDMETDDAESETDFEENAADRFALELLTGKGNPVVLSGTGQGGARALAEAALGASIELGIEPGTIALCFGFSTKNWAVANGAMRHIYPVGKPVWNEVNKIALEQLALETVPYDSQAYLASILGVETPVG
jgi:hypothetical protein